MWTNTNLDFPCNYLRNCEEEPKDYSSNSSTNSPGMQKQRIEILNYVEDFDKSVIKGHHKKEIESSFEERRKLAMNLLSTSDDLEKDTNQYVEYDKNTNRKEALKQNFWIVEDEPLDKSILQVRSEGNEDNKSVEHLETSKAPSKVFICHVCGKLLKGRSSLRTHIHLHIGLKSYKCVYCSKKFTQSCVLKNHLRTHTGETPYSCYICSSSFKTLSNLRKHLLTHTKIRSFKCVVCPKTFKNKAHLETHLKIHISEPHLCEICKTLFDSRRSLSVHIHRKHKRRNIFSCSVCNKAYEFRSLLKQHLTFHTNERKHSCDVCGSSYVWKSGLAAHMRTHSFRLQCEICGLKFIYLKKLEKHRSRHSDPFPYKCNKCKKEFKYAYLLKAHLSKHKDDLSCPDCNLGFMTKSKFKNHLKTHS